MEVYAAKSISTEVPSGAYQQECYGYKETIGLQGKRNTNGADKRISICFRFHRSFNGYFQGRADDCIYFFEGKAGRL